MTILLMLLLGVSYNTNAPNAEIPLQEIHFWVNQCDTDTVCANVLVDTLAFSDSVYYSDTISLESRRVREMLFFPTVNLDIPAGTWDYCITWLWRGQLGEHVQDTSVWLMNALTDTFTLVTTCDADFDTTSDHPIIVDVPWADYFYLTVTPDTTGTMTWYIQGQGR